MFKRTFSAAFILSSIMIIAMGFPLFGGWIEPNALYGFTGEVPLEDSEWMDYNRVFGAGMFAYGSLLLSYHIIALFKLKSLSNGSYALRGLISAVLSLIPAYVIMLIVQ